ncbi:Uncharacterised protein [BD1-7 clade bacterium]|uniref:SSD domain-containing protein n=1 Tax=BD1-7 clade bacterium TaxID=2029982 RepID=A0A5S9R0V9_9GAMM|nr:Uncharacterised protein [BD1-7 clade bacterium]
MPFHTHFRWVGLALALTLIASGGLVFLKTSANYRVYFDPQHPLLQNAEQMASRFALHDSLVAMVTTDEATSIDAFPVIDATLDLKDTLTQISGVSGVDAFTDVLAGNPALPIDSDSLANQLINRPAHTGLIVIDTDLKEPGNANAILAFTQAIEDAFTNAYAGLNNVQIGFTGPIALNAAYIDVVRHDLKIFIPGLLILMFIALTAIFHRPAIAIAMITQGLLATLAAFGIVGYLGFTLAAINAFVPVIIIGLTVITAMHPVFGVYHFRLRGAHHEQAIQQSFSDNRQPLILSSLTTAAGFLLLVSSPSPPIRVVGVAVAAGMAIACLLNLTLLPWWLQRLTIQQRTVARTIGAAQQVCLPLKRWTKHRRTPLITSAVCAAVFSIAALTTLKINDNFYHYFPAGHPFRTTTDNLDAQFPGSASINYQLRFTKQNTSEGNNANTPSQASLNEYQQILDWLTQQPEVAAVLAVEPAQLNKASLDWLRQTNTKAASTLTHWISDDTQYVRLQLRIPQMNAADLLALEQKISTKLHQNEHIEATQGSSPDVLFARLSITNATNMFWSLSLALLSISLLIGAMLRSLTATVLALFCNLLPVMLVYGLWSLAGGFITLGTAVVMGMIMGIIVDDTLHLLIKHRRISRHAKDSPQATTNTGNLWESVIPPVLLSSLVLMLALSIGLLSDFRPIAELSFLSIAAIALAGIADALILPALLASPAVRQRF